MYFAGSRFSCGAICYTVQSYKGYRLYTCVLHGLHCHPDEESRPISNKMADVDWALWRQGSDMHRNGAPGGIFVTVSVWEI